MRSTERRYRSLCDPATEETVMVTRRPSEETARLGDEIYERDIRQQVEADQHGAVVRDRCGTAAVGPSATP